MPEEAWRGGRKDLCLAPRSLQETDDRKMCDKIVPWKILNVGGKMNIKRKMNASLPRFCGSRSLWEDSRGAVRVGRLLP